MTFSGSGDTEPPPVDPTTASSAAGSEAPDDVNGSTEPDWTDQVTELVVDTVDKVRSHTTGPVLNVAHGSVYGIVAVIIVIPILIAFFAGLVKGLNWLLPGDVAIVYCIIAVMLWLGGWLAWRQRDRSALGDT